MPAEAGGAQGGDGVEWLVSPHRLDLIAARVLAGLRREDASVRNGVCEWPASVKPVIGVSD